ncbi:AAA family ATPase [uncultured Meiothermus sp.]|jgi:DNA polymerase III delta prime subunit|uniref:AAA family ATPase n=1 Tax=uncultured Meiothermus sp. TaxID=157471 RepID=UPI002622379B|nr:AAA family ATPase [uncultured Meiothermus sp.]
MAQTQDYINPADVDKIVEDWLASEYGDVLDDEVDFVQTRATRIIAARLRDAVEDQFPFALVTGPAGCSKTVTAKHFLRYVREQWPDLNTAWIHAQPSYEPGALLEDLALNLYITRTRRFRDLLGTVHTQLGAKRMVAVVDEAQRMPRDSYEVLKYLADETSSTFILIATEDFAPQIRRWRDIESRIGVIAEAEPVEADELAQMPLLAGLPRASLQKIHDLTGGVMRDVLRLMKQIDRAIGKNADKGLNRANFAPKNVTAVAKKLNLAGGGQP